MLGQESVMNDWILVWWVLVFVYPTMFGFVFVFVFVFVGGEEEVFM